MKRLISLALATLMLLGLCACGQAAVAPSASTQSETGSQQIYPTLDSSEEYIFILCLNSIEYFNAHKYEWNKLGDMFGVKTSIMGPADFDLPATATTIEQAIAMKPKGICLFGVDPSLNPSIDKATEAGIPVVCIIGDQVGSQRLAYVGSYGQDLGRLGGEKLAEALGGKGKVAILTIPGFEQWDVREQGYREAFANYPGIEVVAVGDTKADTVTAVQAAKDILVKYPDLVGFVGCDSTAAMGAATAVEETGNVGKVKIIGMDRNADLLEKINKGVITGTVAQDDVGMMYWALLTLISRNHYRPLLASDNVAAGAIVEPDIIYLPPNFIDTTNLQYYVDADKMYAEGAK